MTAPSDGRRNSNSVRRTLRRGRCVSDQTRWPLLGSGFWSGLVKISKLCSADRWGTRRCLTGWGQAATWPSADYKRREEGKEITPCRAAFLTSQLLSDHAEGNSWAKIPLLRHLSFLFFFSLFPLLTHPCSHYRRDSAVLGDLNRCRGTEPELGQGWTGPTWRPCPHPHEETVSLSFRSNGFAQLLLTNDNSGLGKPHPLAHHALEGWTVLHLVRVCVPSKSSQR